MNSSQRRLAARSGQAERETPHHGHYADRELAIRQALEAGLQFHRAGDFQIAAEFYYDALEARPNQHDALHLLGLISFQSGDFLTATRLIGCSIDVCVDDAVPHITLGDVFQAEERYDEALQSYRRGILIDSNLPEAHNNRGNAFHALQRYLEAVASYKYALALKPGYAVALNNLGNTLRELARFEEAISAYRHALAFHPDSATVHNNLGNALRDRGDLTDAVLSHRQALEIDPGLMEAYFNLGNALCDLGRYEDAAASFVRAIEIDRRFPDAHYNLGNVRRELGDLQEAVACYHRTVSVDPGHVDAYNNLGNVLNDLDLVDQALSAFRIVLELDPERVNARHMSAALAGIATAAAPEAYIRDLFDFHAAAYESYVVDELDYRAPQAVAQAVLMAGGGRTGRFSRVLDLGCGTGLAARALEGRIDSCIGVDLSPMMIAEARKTSLYTHLHEDETVRFLATQSLIGATFELVLAADVFGYTGNLDDTLSGVRGCIAPDGLFAFTTELSDGGDDYALQRSGRYVHSDRYLAELAERKRFDVVSREATALRTENGVPVMGSVFVLKPR